MNEDYIIGWNDTAYAFNNWNSNGACKTPQEWAKKMKGIALARLREMGKTIAPEQKHNYHYFTACNDCCNQYLRTGKVEKKKSI
jgi:hypothetical protein